MDNHSYIQDRPHTNEQGQKWWLDSQTIRSGLLTSVPTIVTVLALFNVQVENAQVELFVNGVAALVGVVGLVNLMLDRFSKKDITFKRPNA